jgi:amidase
LSRAYDDTFRKVDVLAMPTVPILPLNNGDRVSLAEELARWRTIFANTSPFNVTGHPALTVPCGTLGRLPVGMMLVAPMWSEARLLTVAHALEQAASTTRDQLLRRGRGTIETE